MSASPATTSSAAGLIVCEATGSWSAALRRELAETGVHLRECRRLAEAWQALAQTPAAFVIAEADPENLEELLRRMAWFSRDFPHARIAVVASRGMARFQGCCARRGQSNSSTRRGGWRRWPPSSPAIWPMCRRRNKRSSSGSGLVYPGRCRERRMVLHTASPWD